MSVISRKRIYAIHLAREALGYVLQMDLLQGFFLSFLPQICTGIRKQKINPNQIESNKQSKPNKTEP